MQDRTRRALKAAGKVALDAGAIALAAVIGGTVAAIVLFLLAWWWLG